MQNKKKGLAVINQLTLCEYGRRSGIRTRDPLHPMQVRYQAALYAEPLIVAVEHVLLAASERV